MPLDASLAKFIYFNQFQFINLIKFQPLPLGVAFLRVLAVARLPWPLDRLALVVARALAVVSSSAAFVAAPERLVPAAGGLCGTLPPYVAELTVLDVDERDSESTFKFIIKN